MAKIANLKAFEDLEKHDPLLHYRRKRGYIKAGSDITIVYGGASAPILNTLIEAIGEYYFIKWAYEFYKSRDLIDEPGAYFFGRTVAKYELLLQKYLPEFANGITTGEQQKRTIYDGLYGGGGLRAVTLKEHFEKCFNENLVKTCPSCGHIYLASRKDSQSCDDCRNRANVRKFREKHKTDKKPICCAECGFEFTPKSKKAKFCSDRCRVRANRRKNN